MKKAKILMICSIICLSTACLGILISCWNKREPKAIDWIINNNSNYTIQMKSTCNEYCFTLFPGETFKYEERYEDDLDDLKQGDIAALYCGCNAVLVVFSDSTKQNIDLKNNMSVMNVKNYETKNMCHNYYSMTYRFTDAIIQQLLFPTD